MSVITKIVIEAGHIQSREKLLTEDMNRELLKRAQDALSELQSGVARVSKLVTEYPEMTVSLGSPELPENIRTRMMQDWQGKTPGGKVSEYEEMLAGVNDFSAKLDFT